jgi:predicted metal-dependent phosphoesterase TrpH
MRNFIDLHTHSTASDGTMPPAEVIALADRKHLAAVALTDHDTVGGLAEAAAAASRYPSLRFIHGIEISALFKGGTLHILGLGIDPQSPVLVKMASDLRAARENRNPQIVEALTRLGMPLTMDDVLAEVKREAQHAAQRVVGRVHIAAAMVRKGYVATTTEAFDKYICNDGPAFVNKEKMTPAAAIAAIRTAGGAAVLAHPSQLNYDNSGQLERILRDLMGHGLSGIEVYHSDHTPEQTRLFLNLARRHKLGITGGSDFHGHAMRDVRMGLPRVPRSVVSGELEKIVFRT